MKTDYSDHLIKEYVYWTLGVHPNQGYLGRCVVWCKRADAKQLTDATPEEQKELFHVLYEAKHTLQQSFAPDWFNYAFFGNEVPHLHGHLVPRYKKPVLFMNKYFVDKHFGRHYQTDSTHITPQDVLYGVRDEIKRHIV